MSSGPAVSKRHASRLFTVHHKVTPACFRHARAHDPHVARSTRVVGKRSGRNSGRGKNPPQLPAHRSGPGPTTCCAYVWPRPGGSCRCTKVGALLLTPLLVHGQSEPPATATHNRAGKGSRREAEGTRQTKQRQGPRPQRSDGRSRFPRQGPLPGQPQRPRQDPCRGSSPTPAERATFEPTNARQTHWDRAREAPPWWHADLCEDKE